MSEADKMFEELGYKLGKENKEELICYYEDDNGYIMFFEDKHVALEGNECESILAINTHELKAINTKVKELGWEE